jgi:hypothetical protein
MAFCCVEGKPCNGARALFRCRRSTLQLRRAFGKMKVGGGRRRAGSFSSVRAVFWPLMSMRSDADDRPRSASTDETPRAASSTTAAMVLPALQDRQGDGTTGASRAPSPTTAATVLALQARLGVPASPPKATATTSAASPARDVTVTPPTTAAATRVVAALLGDAATPTNKAGAVSPARDVTPGATAAATRVVVALLGDAATPTNKAGTIHVQAVREHATVVDVEEACRSFEKHLMEMLVEERKVMDLTDVEDLLCCWDKLRSPVFAQLVGRFYGELCMDLFSGGSDGDESVV